MTKPKFTYGDRIRRKAGGPIETVHDISEKAYYFSQPFAVHIVKEDYPHDLLLTLLLQQKRTWYGRRKDTIEVIDYTEKGNPT